MKALHTGAAAFLFAAGLAVGGGTAWAEKTEMDIALTGSEQVPPVETSGKGEAEVTYDSDTKMLTWTLTYEGLSGEATAAHFHGPADPGENAPPVVPIEDTASGSEGSAELTDEQAEQLMAGKWYINVHTAEHPDGEIRGQVKSGM